MGMALPASALEIYGLISHTSEALSFSFSPHLLLEP